jgi:hypothetical protein
VFKNTLEKLPKIDFIMVAFGTPIVLSPT